MIWALVTVTLIAVILGIFWGEIKWRNEKIKWDEALNAPEYIVRPSYDLGYDIWQKKIFPTYGCAPMVRYMPLYGQYKTRENAEKQLAHYEHSNVGKSDGE